MAPLERGWKASALQLSRDRKEPQLRSRCKLPTGSKALAAVAVLGSVALPLARAADASPAESPGWMLPQHSFERTLTWDDRLGNWLTSAATMALRNRIQLLPPVPDRYALFWNKMAIQSQDFEVSFTFRAQAKDPSSGEHGAFAFWLGPGNFAAGYNEQAIVTVRNWTQGLQTAGLSILSNKPHFKGLGIFFYGQDRAKTSKPTVTIVLSDGTMSLHDILPPQSQPQNNPAVLMQVKPAEWRRPEVTVNVRLSQSGAIVGSVQTDLDKVPFALKCSPSQVHWSDTFFGFSGWSGAQALELDLHRVTTRNFDARHVGEGDLDMFEGDAAEWVKRLEEDKRYVDQRSQKEAVQKLTKLLADHVDRYNKVGEKVKSEMVWINNRLSRLEVNISGFTSSLKVVDLTTGEHHTDSVKTHIRGIRSIFMKDNEEHNTKLGRVHDAARSLKERGGGVLGVEGQAKVKSVADQAKELEDHVSQGTLQANGLLGVLVFIVAVVGCLFLNRMRYYEKKHYI